ncbi:hypothetical protein BDZ91DRAFT_719421, partial [Kalaharituber pfeilii]
MRVKLSTEWALHFLPLSQSYCSARSHLPPSLTLSSSRYTTTELVFFPSSSKVSFFFSHRIPVILPRS